MSVDRNTIAENNSIKQQERKIKTIIISETAKEWITN